MSTLPSTDQLPALGFLAELDASHRAFLAPFGTFARPAKGDAVIVQGKPQGHLHLILSGKLHVVYEEPGSTDGPLPVATLESGDAVGEVNLFDPATASASAYAREDCVIWKISKQGLDAFIAADPAAGLEFTQGLLKLLSQRLRAMNGKLADAAGMAKAIHAMSHR